MAPGVPKPTFQGLIHPTPPEHPHMSTCTTRVLTLALAVFAVAAFAVPAGAFARGATSTTTVGAVNLFPNATAPGAKGRVLSNNHGTGSGLWPMSYQGDRLAGGR